MTQQTRHQNCQAALRIVRAPFYPYITKGGTITRTPVTDHDAGHNCQDCQYLAGCSEIVSLGGYALCENVIAAEILPRAVVQQMQEVAHVQK